MIGRRHIFVPEIGPPPLDRDPGDDRDHREQNHDRGDQRDRLVEWDRTPGESSKHPQPRAGTAVALTSGGAACGRCSIGTRVRDDGVVESGDDGAIGNRFDVAAWLRELGISPGIEGLSLAACGLSPGGELPGRDRLHLEPHSRKSVTAEMRGHAVIDARPISPEVKARRHPRHRVDHRSKLGHEEAVPYGRRRKLVADRNSRRNDELVDRGDPLVRIDEQPFPIERDDLDPERRSG